MRAYDESGAIIYWSVEQFIKENIDPKYLSRQDEIDKLLILAKVFFPTCSRRTIASYVGRTKLANSPMLAPVKIREDLPKDGTEVLVSPVQRENKINVLIGQMALLVSELQSLRTEFRGILEQYVALWRKRDDLKDRLGMAKTTIRNLRSELERYKNEQGSDSKSQAVGATD